MIDYYEKNAFDYLDFMSNQIFDVTAKIIIMEENFYNLHPAAVQVLIIDCQVQLLKVRSMLNVPEKELIKGASRWRQL